MMKIEDLLNMDAGSAIDWLERNQHKFALIETEPKDCIKCGSMDVGASCKSAYCYNCQHETRADSTIEAVIKWNFQR